MSDLSHLRGRRLAASAVAFLLPARHDVNNFVFQQETPQTCTRAKRWISSSVPSPACPDNSNSVAARPPTTGSGNHHCCRFGGVGACGALFAAAEQNEDEPRSSSLAQKKQKRTDPAGHDLTDTEPLPGGPGRISGRIPEPMGSSRWERLRSTRLARALGRVFRGRSGLAEEHGTLNSVVSGQV